jgi:hypothetical protein
MRELLKVCRFDENSNQVKTKKWLISYSCNKKQEAQSDAFVQNVKKERSSKEIPLTVFDYKSGCDFLNHFDMNQRKFEDQNQLKRWVYNILKNS